MTELKHLYPPLSCQLKLLQCLTIICLKYELCDMSKSLLCLFNSVLLIQCFELITDSILHIKRGSLNPSAPQFPLLYWSYTHRLWLIQHFSIQTDFLWCGFFFFFL